MEPSTSQFQPFYNPLSFLGIPQQSMHSQPIYPQPIPPGIPPLYPTPTTPGPFYNQQKTANAFSIEDILGGTSGEGIKRQRPGTEGVQGNTGCLRVDVGSACNWSNGFGADSLVNKIKSAPTSSLPPSETHQPQNKSKRANRTVFTAEQLMRLEQEFTTQQYIVGTQRTYLAAELNLTETQVRIWFQNRRIKWRKQNINQSLLQNHQQERIAMLGLYCEGQDCQNEPDLFTRSCDQNGASGLGGSGRSDMLNQQNVNFQQSFSVECSGYRQLDHGS